MENEIKFNLEVMGSSDVESMHKVLDAFKKLDTEEKYIMKNIVEFK